MASCHLLHPMTRSPCHQQQRQRQQQRPLAPCCRGGGSWRLPPGAAWTRPRPRGRAAPCATTAAAPAASAQIRLTGTLYEDIVQQLAGRALRAASLLPPGRRLLIGIAGAPGSGKSTLASMTHRQVNLLAAQQPGSGPGGELRTVLPGQELCTVLPMDGFHLYRRQLDEMPNRQEAHARRGAPWTFDAPAFISCVRRAAHEPRVPVPSFDHGRGDPVEGDLQVLPQHRIVLVEGNYVLLDTEPWCELKQLLDDTWFVDVDLDVAMQRVFQRQVALGVDPEESRRRIAGNDRPNGELVNSSHGHAAVLVPSSVPLGQH